MMALTVGCRPRYRLAMCQLRDAAITSRVAFSGWAQVGAKEVVMTVAEDRLNAFLGRAVGDMAASVSAVLVLIGDELGLYSALAGQRLSPGELAEKTGTSERYVREWLANQAAGGYA